MLALMKLHPIRGVLLELLRAQKGNFGSLFGTDFIITKKPILANRLFYLFAEMLRMI